MTIWIIWNISYNSHNMKGIIKDNEGLNRGCLLWWGPLQHKDCWIHCPPSIICSVCCIFLTYDGMWDVKPDKFLSWANLAKPLTGFSLQTITLPPTAQIIYHPSGRFIITWGVLRGQEDKRKQKEGLKDPPGWDIDLFNQTSC